MMGEVCRSTGVSGTDGTLRSSTYGGGPSGSVRENSAASAVTGVASSPTWERCGIISVSTPVIPSGSVVIASATTIRMGPPMTSQCMAPANGGELSSGSSAGARGTAVTDAGSAPTIISTSSSRGSGSGSRSGALGGVAQGRSDEKT